MPTPAAPVAPTHRLTATITAGTVAAVLLLAGCHSASTKTQHSSGGAASTSAAKAPPSSASPAHGTLQVSAGAPLPAAMSREVALTDGDRVVLLGGLDASGTSTSRVLRVDPATGAATRLGSLAQSTHDAAGAVLNGAFVVFGGGEQRTIDTVQAVAPDRAASVIGHLPQPRSDLVTAPVGGHVYVLGGFDGTRATPDVLDTTDGVHFSVLTRLPTAVRYGAVAVTGHRIWLFGGESGAADTDLIQVVDLDSGTAQVAGHLPARLAHASAVAVAGRVVVAGGRLNGTPTARTWLFDPSAVAVTDGPVLPRPLLDAAPAAVGDTGYLFGGESPKPIADVVVLRMVPG